MNDEPDLQTETLAETTSFMIYRAEEPDGETTYHLELGMATHHFFQEEWDEFLDLVQSLATVGRNPENRK